MAELEVFQRVQGQDAAKPPESAGSPSQTARPQGPRLRRRLGTELPRTRRVHGCAHLLSDSFQRLRGNPGIDKQRSAPCLRIY